MRSASRTAASGFAWSSVSQLIKVGCQFLGVVFLARLLPPADFGLVAIASVITGFAALFRDFGTAAAVIQRPVLTQELLDSVFWFNVAVGGALALIALLLSPFIVWFFSEPRLLDVVWLFALTFPIGAMGIVHQSLFERASNFRIVALVESVAALVGLGTAIAGALAGWGVYSLVGQALVNSSVIVAGFWVLSDWKPGKRGSIAEIKSLWGFGGNLVGFNVINYFLRNSDNLLIGRFLGATELGFYSMAYKLMLWPLQNVSSVVGRVLLPVYSRLQADRERLRVAYVQTTAAITLVTAPMIVGFFVLREPFVVVALGGEWKPVADVLAWLLPVGLLQSIGSSVGTLYMATGRTDVMFKWGLAAGFLILPAFVIGLQWGIVGVAAGYAVATLLLFWPSLAIPFRFIGLKVKDLLIPILPALGSAMFMGFAIVSIANKWPPTDENRFAHLLFLIFTGIVAYVFISVIAQRRLLTRILEVVLNR